MTWVLRRALSGALPALVLLVVLGVTAVPTVAAPLAVTEPVFGAATGKMDDEGSMTPTGQGRFTIDDRIYVGKSLGRSTGGKAAACFTGELRAVEDWSLESPRLTGDHRSTVTIRSERGTVVLRLRGEMEYPSASGAWAIVRATGDCGDFKGEGQYTATFATASDRPDYRLTFDGETEPS